jgi:hypothetical protein
MENIQKTRFQTSIESWITAQHHILREFFKLMNDSEKIFMNHITMFEYPIHINKILLESGLSTDKASYLLDFFDQHDILNVNKDVTPGQVNKGKYYDLLVSANEDL